jgi:hypothetical protein
MSFKATKGEVLRAWPFADAPNTASFTSTHIFKQGMPILQVSHDENDGAWQFHSGQSVTTKDLMIVGLDEIVRLDASIAALADLPLGWQATRSSPSSEWVRKARKP